MRLLKRNFYVGWPSSGNSGAAQRSSESRPKTQRSEQWGALEYRHFENWIPSLRIERKEVRALDGANRINKALDKQYRFRINRRSSKDALLERIANIMATNCSLPPTRPEDDLKQCIKLIVLISKCITPYRRCAMQLVASTSCLHATLVELRLQRLSQHVLRAKT